MNRTIGKIALGLISFVLFFVVAKQIYLAQNEHELNDMWTIVPDQLLLGMKVDSGIFMVKQRLEYIDLSIAAMQSVRDHSIGRIGGMLDSSMISLKTIRELCLNDQLTDKEYERASVKAMNSLAMAHLSFSKKLDYSGETAMTVKCMSMSMEHLRNARKMTSDPKQKAELQIVITELELIRELLEKNGHYDEVMYAISIVDLSNLIGQ